MNITKKQKVTLRDNLDYWVFLLIPLAVYGVFFIFPNIKAIILSFFEWDGLNPEKTFVGINNYIHLFTKDFNFLTAFKNTLVYTVVVIVFQNIFALLIALLIHDSTKKMNSIYRTLIYMPYMFSSVAVGFIWTFILDPNLGIINKVLTGVGLEQFALSWLSDPRTAIFAVAAVHIWFGIGQGMILFIAGLQQIPGELYEAASVDGCPKIKEFFYITVPMLKPITLTIVVLTILGCFKSFDFVYLLTNGGADGSSTVLALRLYKEAFQYSKVGYSSAISVVLLVTVLIISAIQFKLFKEKEEK